MLINTKWFISKTFWKKNWWKFLLLIIWEIFSITFFIVMFPFDEDILMYFVNNFQHVGLKDYDLHDLWVYGTFGMLFSFIWLFIYSIWKIFFTLCLKGVKDFNGRQKETKKDTEINS